MLKILVYGKTGQVAKSIYEHAKDHDCEVINFGRPEIQINDFNSINDLISIIKPDVLINAAAYNNVDGAQIDFETALDINCYGPKVLANAAKIANIPFIHISTDYVFDGTKGDLYNELDITNPINKYGESKLLGEHAVLEANENSVILRVSWVYSEFSNNFVKSMLKIAKTKKAEISVVDDQIGIPTSAHDIANTILIISKKLVEQKSNKSLRGIFHYTAQNPINRFEYAKIIFQKSKELNLDYCIVKPIKSYEFETPAKRPHSTPLNCKKITEIFPVVLFDWQISFNVIFKKIIDSI